LEVNTQTSQRSPLMTLGIAVLVFVLALNAFISYRATKRLIRSNDSVEHTRLVELKIQTIRSMVLSAETAQRGYLLTDRGEYLEPYNTASSRLPSHVQQLSNLVADSPEQSARAAQLQIFVDNKLSELRKTIEMRRAGQSIDAAGLVESDLGKHLMDRIRDVLAEMSAQEADLLKQREAAAHSSAVMAFSAFGVTTFVAVIGLLLLGRGLSREMHTRAVASAAIREREQWLETTIQSIGDAVIATDNAGTVKFLNPVAQQLLGIDTQPVGKPIYEVLVLVNETTRARVENPVERVIESGRIVGIANHTVLCRADGTEIPIDDSAAPIRDAAGDLIGVVMVFRDVTEQRKMDAALRTTEKLAAAGRLAATVAHEINNPLEAVTNLMFLLRNDASISEAGRKLLEMADEQLRRVAHTTKQTLAFYRDTGKGEAVVLTAACRRVLEIYKSKLAAKNITVECDSNDIAVFAPTGEVVQVLSNLIANAIDALREGGRLAVTVAAEGETAVIAVEDDGDGIDESLAEKVFEPFFTTKKDVGTGLGLWISRNIVEHLGGTITISRPGSGKGARFEVRMPAYRAEKSSGASAKFA
jgi:PAS domain S-box-containing protein